MNSDRGTKSLRRLVVAVSLLVALGAGALVVAMSHVDRPSVATTLAVSHVPVVVPVTHHSTAPAAGSSAVSQEVTPTTVVVSPPTTVAPPVTTTTTVPPSPGSVVVPDVVGDTTAAAAAALSVAGLQDNDGGAPCPTVSVQTPAGGTVVAPGSSVTLDNIC